MASSDTYMSYGDILYFIYGMVNHIIILKKKDFFFTGAYVGGRVSM